MSNHGGFFEHFLTLVILNLIQNPRRFNVYWRSKPAMT